MTTRSANRLSLAVAAAAGLLFGLGLAVSEMIDPQKVKAFLDIAAVATGAWDPSLAIVMGVGLITAAAFFRLSRPMPKPFAAPRFASPSRTEIDSRLVGGAALFGVGWGLSGLCPGPAIADLGIAAGDVGWFVAAMLLGSWATTWLSPAAAPALATATPE